MGLCPEVGLPHGAYGTEYTIDSWFVVSSVSRVYTDRGTVTCAHRPGSQDKEELDAKTYAAWGVGEAQVAANASCLF